MIAPGLPTPTPSSSKPKSNGNAWPPTVAIITIRPIAVTVIRPIGITVVRPIAVSIMRVPVAIATTIGSARITAAITVVIGHLFHWRG
jgi:hypothetical protein